MNMLVAQIRGSALLFIFLNLLAASAPAMTPKIPVPMVMPPNIRLVTKKRIQLSIVRPYCGKKKKMVLLIPLVSEESLMGELEFYST